MPKVSKFDRVISGGKKVWDKGQEDLPVISKPFRAVESKLEKKAEDYEKSGSPVKGKIARVGSVISGALTPTKFDAAITGAGALVKGTMVAKNAYKAYKSGKKAKFSEKMARGRVQSSNKLQEEAKEAGLRTVKDFKTKKTSRIIADKDKTSEYAISKTKKNMDRVMLRKGKKIEGNPASYEREEVKRMRKNDSDLTNELQARREQGMKLPFGSEEKGFTKRGKPIGKKIGDQGGARTKAK